MEVWVDVCVWGFVGFFWLVVGGYCVIVVIVFGGF